MLYLQIILAFLNNFIRTDFITLLSAMYIVAILFTSYYSDTIRHCMNFLKLLIVSIFYDLIWLIFCSSVYIFFKISHIGVVLDKQMRRMVLECLFL
jgi:hypothetical protein